METGVAPLRESDEQLLTAFLSAFFVPWPLSPSVVANFGAAELGNKKWEERSFFELLNEEKEFAQKTVDDLMQYPYAPKRNPFHPIQQVRRHGGLTADSRH